MYWYLTVDPEGFSQLFHPECTWDVSTVNIGVYDWPSFDPSKIAPYSLGAAIGHLGLGTNLI